MPQNQWIALNIASIERTMQAMCEFVIIGVMNSVTEFATNQSSNVGPLMQERGVTWCRIEFTEQGELNVGTPTQTQGIFSIGSAYK